MTIQEQVENELRRHLERQAKRVQEAGADVENRELLQTFRAEFLTGASQVLRWLITNDGNEKMTPQVIERACVVVGKELGFTVGSK